MQNELCLVNLTVPGMPTYLQKKLPNCIKGQKILTLVAVIAAQGGGIYQRPLQSQILMGHILCFNAGIGPSCNKRK